MLHECNFADADWNLISRTNPRASLSASAQALAHRPFSGRIFWFTTKSRFYEKMHRNIFTVCRYLYRIFYMVFIRKKFRILTTSFALIFAVIFFAACGESNWNDGVHYIWLTGSNSGYRISSYKNTDKYYREGYIYNKGFFEVISIPKNPLL